jgi:hypothetical protein
MLANSLRNLPPEVRRELLRHVKPPRARTTEAATKKKSSTKILLGCAAFVGCAASLPYWATQTIGNLTEREDALTAAQVRRGAFMNSGTKDAGKDPNWKSGRYTYSKGFAEHLKRSANPDETDLGPDLGPMVQEQKSQKQQPKR